VCVHRTECRARARVVQRPPKTVSETINTRTRVYYLTKRAYTSARYSLFTFLKFENDHRSQEPRTVENPSFCSQCTHWNSDVRVAVHPTYNRQFLQRGSKNIITLYRIGFLCNKKDIRLVENSHARKMTTIPARHRGKYDTRFRDEWTCIP